MDRINNILESIKNYFYEDEKSFKKPDGYKNVNTSQTQITKK